MDPFTLRRRTQAMRPRRPQQQQFSGGFGGFMDDPLSEDPFAENQDDDFNLEASSQSLTNAEQEADEQAGGIIHDRGRMQRFLDAMTANENAARPRMEAFTKHLENAPQREQYAPNKTDRFTAALTGFGTGYVEGPSRGIAAAQSQLQRPFMEARQDWQDRIVPMQHAAEIEERGFTNKNNQILRGMQVGISADRAATSAKNAASLQAAREKQMANIDSMMRDRKSGIQGMSEDAQGHVVLVKRDGSYETLPFTTMEWTKYKEQQRQFGASNAVANRNAATAEGQLDVALSNAATRKQELEVRRQRQIDSTPAKMMTARDLALQELAGYPAFRGMIQVDPNINKTVVAPFDEATMDYNMYSGLLDEIDRRMQLYGSGKTSVTPSPIPRRRN